MTNDVEARISELGRMSDTRLKTEHFKVFGWEPLFEGRKEMIEKLTAHLREQAGQADSTTKIEGMEDPMDASATTAISKLRRMDLKELQAEYERVCGKPSKSRNREWLFKTVARKLQGDESEQATGPSLTAKFEKKAKSRSRNVSKSAGKKKAKGEKKTRVRAIGERDPRLPKAGTTLTREWHGKKYLVKVLDQGFEYGGKPYRSLSGVAKAISGQIVNGFLWFGLTTTEKKVS